MKTDHKKGVRKKETLIHQLTNAIANDFATASIVIFTPAANRAEMEGLVETVLLNQKIQSIKKLSPEDKKRIIKAALCNVIKRVRDNAVCIEKVLFKKLSQ